jgi:[acyl-carrier-protein] S-malonyltransferase
MAGLSLGEWSALYAAGVLSFEDTLKVLEARGRFMQDACDACDSGMVSVIGLSMDQLENICSETGVSIANLNSEQQTVLSGETAAVAAAAQMATEAGAKRAIVLNVAGAYHSPIMEPAAKRLEEVLAAVEVNEPKVPVVSNVTGKPHASVEDIRKDMINQVTSSVRWLASIQWFAANGVDAYVECGPGKVLSGLIKRIDKSATLNNIQDISTLEKTVEALSNG